jgi:hypothetical protein
MQEVKAPFLNILSPLPEEAIPISIALWIWEYRRHWLLHPTQVKLSLLDGLMNGPPWTDRQIKRLIKKGYLDNELALFTVQKFTKLVLFLIERKFLSGEKALVKALEYSNYKLLKDIIVTFPRTNVQSAIIYAYHNFMWDMIDFMNTFYNPSTKELEFLMSNESYYGLVHYLIVEETVPLNLDTMQLAAKCGNMYVFMKMTEISKDVVPNYDTLILAAGSGDIDLVKYLVETYNIEPEELAFKNAGNHEVVRYFSDTRHVPLYEGVFEAICERGLLESVKFFLEEKIVIPDFDICSISARSGNVDLLRYLISYGFQVWVSSLEEAAKNGHLDLFKYLSLEQNIQIPDGILVLACRSGKKDIIQYLVEDLKYVPNIECVEAVSESGSMEGFLYLINLPNISFTLNDANSVCIGGNVIMLNYLVEKFDIQPDIRCLNEALKRGNRDIFIYIHKLFGHIFLEANSETLIAAIEGKQVDFVEYLFPQYRIRRKGRSGLTSMLLTPLQRKIIRGLDSLFEDFGHSDGGTANKEQFADDQSSEVTNLDPVRYLKRNRSLSQASMRISEDYTVPHEFKRITRLYCWVKRHMKNPEPYLNLEVVIDKFATDQVGDLKDIAEDQEFFSEDDLNLDESKMDIREPIIVDEQIMFEIFKNGTPEILDFIIEIEDSWGEYKYLPYLMGNLPLVKYLIKNLQRDPTPYQLKLAAASGNVELLKYLSSQRNLEHVEGALDFACILGKINPVMFYAKQKSFEVDNLLLELANESKNPKLQKFLHSFKPKKLNYVEYFFRKQRVYAFQNLYKDLI